MRVAADVDPLPRISVIIPAYNEERYLAATLQNVARAIGAYQRTYGRTVEVIVADNRSTDRTAEVAAAHGARVVFEAKRQIAAARNAGARAARGEIVAFLDADDHMSENLLCLVEEAMASGQCIGGGVKIVYDRESWAVKLYNGWFNLLRRFFGTSAGLIFTWRTACQAVGGFNEKYHAAEELRFVLDIKALGQRQGKRFHVIRQGHVVKSARKFDEYGGVVILLGTLIFCLNPWLVRVRRACFFWYGEKARP